MDNRLRATAAPSTPHDVRNSPRLSEASTYSGLLSDRTADMSVRSTDSQFKTTGLDDCTFCASIGHLLVCCRSSNALQCPLCVEVGEVFAKEDQKYEEASALRDRVERLETESPEKYERLYEEKSAKIGALKSQVAQVNKEDESLKTEIKEQEKILKKGKNRKT